MGGFFAKEILEAALQIERNGRAFYTKLAQAMEEPDIKNTFGFLASEEHRHIEEINALTEGLEEPPDEPEREDYDLYLRGLVDGHVFAEEGSGLARAEQVMDALDAVEVGIAFEKDSIIFFQELYPVLRKKEHAVLDKLVQWEREHLANLIRLKQQLIEARADQP